MHKKNSNLAENTEAREKLETLYRLYAKRLLYTAMEILQDSGDAEEVVQRAFLKIAYMMDEISYPENPETYAMLHILVRSMCFKLLRKRRQNGTAALGESCQNGIPEKYWAPMVLYYVNKMFTEKIANLLGLPRCVVIFRILRGRQLLKNKSNKDKNEKKEPD